MDVDMVNNAERPQLGHTGGDTSTQHGINGVQPNRRRRIRRSRAQLHSEKAELAQRPQEDDNVAATQSGASDNSATKKILTPFELMEKEEAKADKKFERKQAKLARRLEARKPKNEDKGLADLIEKKANIKLPKPKAGHKPRQAQRRAQRKDSPEQQRIAKAKLDEKNEKVHKARAEKGLTCKGYPGENTCACFNYTKSMARGGSAVEGQMLRDLDIHFEVDMGPMISLLDKLEMF